VSIEVNRRQLLKASLGVTAAAGLVAVGADPAAAVRPGGSGPPLPDVPGMSGDRRANEVWYQLDQATLYNPTEEVSAAYSAIIAHLGGNLERTLREKWWEMVVSPEYPRNYAELVLPIRAELQVLSSTQLGVFDTYYRHDHIGLVRAFGLFGEGVLFDPRAFAPTFVHTMNAPPGQLPRGYHTWYAFMRAMMVTGVDTHRWRSLASALGWAWAMQSAAKPAQDVINPPLDREVKVRLAASWLPRSIARLDQDFQTWWLPEGMS
jgi:hypothetical protein